MEKEDYIKAIEELNKEYNDLLSHGEYKRARNKIMLKNLFKARKYGQVLREISRMALEKVKRNLNKKNKKIKSKKQYEIIQQNKDISQNSKVVYTCILGEYDKVYSPLIPTENTKYVIFSDNENIINETKIWEYRPIPEKIKEICNNDNTLINRYIKMHPKEVFPEYDFALYIDGSIRIISDITDLFNRINNKTGLAMHVHPKREDVYEEAKACIKTKKGRKKYIKKQIKKYKKENFPEKYGLFEATVIAIDIKNENSQKILNEWWEEFFKTETYRDQLIFTYILWKNKYEFNDIGILGGDILLNPKFKRYMHRIRKNKCIIKKIKELIRKIIRKIKRLIGIDIEEF